MTPAQVAHIMSLVDQYAATSNAGYIGSFGTPAEARAFIEAALRDAPQQAATIAEARKADDVDRLLHQVFLLCEAVEDAPAIAPQNEHERGFDKGRRFQAKQIRRAIGDWFQWTFCGSSFMGEPVLAAAPTAAEPTIEYKPGEWFDATTVDLMEAFYLSRLPAIREAAKEHGYAIGVHGSLRRDLDLIAMPWRDGASDADTLVEAIQKAACGITQSKYQWEQKPAGRVATSVPICWTHRHGVASDGHIDLSVLAARPSAPTAVEPDERAEFEAWYGQNFPEHSHPEVFSRNTAGNGEYWFSHVQSLRDAYEAGRASKGTK